MRQAIRMKVEKLANTFPRCLVVALAVASGCAGQTGTGILSNGFTPPQGAQFGRGQPDDGAWQKRLMTAVSPDGLAFTRTNQVISD
ncbi:MAG: hypothetical protein FJW40_27505 [Acidobacteria bacterium]|nr:hypothetical protein [Acidobacteriota bacterium]